MRTADFNYHLPPELIAHHPAATRDASRLLVLDRTTGKLEHKRFPEVISYLREGDVLVVNNSKVLPARLRATKIATEGSIEVLLVEEVSRNDWWTMIRPGRRVRPDTRLTFLDREKHLSEIGGEVREKSTGGQYRVEFKCEIDIKELLGEIGEIPLPPYIERPAGPEPEDKERYQTVFAQSPGSVAAPTAGLHFTPGILDEIRKAGIAIAEVTLHVGLGTFAPVKSEDLSGHPMHEERYFVSEGAAGAIREAKKRGGRVVAVGTTSLRVLESVAALHGSIRPGAGRTRLFVYPPYHLRVVDILLTNFHLPESTLLMLVSAFAAPGQTGGREMILRAYAEAVRERYRFFSYGDAMLIL